MPPKKLQKGHRENSTSGDPLRHIKELGRKALQEGDGICFSAADLNKAASITRAWATKADIDDGDSPGLWVAIGEEAQPYLHALYAITLRRSSVSLTPSLGDSLREAYTALRAKLSLELFNTMYDEGTHAPAGTVRALVFKALRAHILRCFAALLADASALLHGKNARRSKRNLQAALDILNEANKLIELCQDDLTSAAMRTIGGVPYRRFVDVLKRELVASRLLEHWSRLLLLLSACQVWADKARMQLHQLAKTLSKMERHVHASWYYRLILNSPCFSYLLSSHVTSLCAEIDSGPTYGLPTHSSTADEDDPPAVPVHVAPTYGSTGLRLVRNAPEGACAILAQWVLRVWTQTFCYNWTADCLATATATAATTATAPSRPPRMATPPLNTRATYELSMRLATLAMISMATSAVEAESLAAGGGAGATPASTPTSASGGRSRNRSGREPPRVMQIEPSQAPKLAMRALVCGRAALAPAFTAVDLPPGVASRLDQWWRAMCNFLRVAVPAPGCRTRFKAADGSGLELDWSILEHQFVVTSPDNEGIPATPSPCVRAALSAGFLTQFTRLVRWLNAQDGHSVWFNCRGRGSNAGWAWDQLIAFGSRTDTTTLVLSLCESLEVMLKDMTAPSGREMCRPWPMSLLQLDIICMVYQQSMQALCRWSRALHRHGGDGDGRAIELAQGVEAAPADETFAPVRLGSVLSFMAVHMMPRVVDVLLDGLRPLRSDKLEDVKYYAQNTLRRMRPVLDLMTLIAAAQFFSAVELSRTLAVSSCTSPIGNGEAGPSSSTGVDHPHSDAERAADRKQHAVTNSKASTPLGLGCGLEPRASRTRGASGSSTSPELEQQQYQQESQVQQAQQQQSAQKLQLLAAAAAAESSAALDRSWIRHMMKGLRLPEMLGSVAGLLAGSPWVAAEERREVAASLWALLRALIVAMPTELPRVVNSITANSAAVKMYNRVNLVQDGVVGAQLAAPEVDGAPVLALLDWVFQGKPLIQYRELVAVLSPTRQLAVEGTLSGQDLRYLQAAMNCCLLEDLMELAPAARMMVSPRVSQQEEEARQHS